MDHTVAIIVISIAAFLLPLLAGRLGVPPVVAEILFGILVGPSVLNFIHDSEVVAYLAELGFLLLMFLSGFEIDFGKLERQGAGQILLGLAIFAVTVYASYEAAGMMGLGVFATLLLATTSVGLVIPTLRNTNRMPTALGQTILISALIADLFTVVGVAVYALIRENGFGPELLNFPALMAVIFLSLLALKRFAWWYPERFERLFEPHDPDEMGTRASLAFMFVFVGLSYAVGVEPILGAFLAGTLVALVFRHRDNLERKLKGFSWGFLIPIFFIHVGTRFHLDALFQPGAFTGAMKLLAAAAAVKIVASGILIFVRRFTLREVLAAGVLLSARLSLVIAVATLGVKLGLVDPVLESQVILLAILTSTLAPALFRILAPRIEPVKAGLPAS